MDMISTVVCCDYRNEAVCVYGYVPFCPFNSDNTCTSTETIPEIVGSDEIRKI